MHATTIVAYTFNAETLCPRCTVAAVVAKAQLENGLGTHPDDDAEDVLGEFALILGIDRTDESSFDSGDFPKVVFASQLDTLDHFPHDCGYDAGCSGCLPERCGDCGVEL